MAYELRKATNYRIHAELTVVIKGVEYKPDLCAYPYKEVDWVHDQIRTEELPLLAIEIVSPRQTVQEIVDKIDLYLDVGIQSCWLVMPFPRSIVVFRDSGQHSFSQGDILDELLNIKMPVDSIFH